MVVYWVIVKNRCQCLQLSNKDGGVLGYCEKQTSVLVVVKDGGSLGCIFWSQFILALTLPSVRPVYDSCLMYIAVTHIWSIFIYFWYFSGHCGNTEICLNRNGKIAGKKSEMIILVCLVQHVLVHEILVIWDFPPLHIDGFRRLLKNTRELCNQD